MSLDDPLSPADPLEAGPAPERVHYETGILLDASDFRDEQTYHRSRLAAAMRALHGWGTVAGLRVRGPEDGDGTLELRVEPGVAIDRIGRLLELPAPWCIRLARWFEGQGTAELRSWLHSPPRAPVDPAVVVDVFMSARSCATALTPSFATGPFEGRDAVAPARIAETPRLELIPRAEGGPAPIPGPRNFAPAPGAAAADQLAFVLGAWEAADETLAPLVEHVAGQDPTSIFLARVAIPVDVDAADPTDRPRLDLTQPVHVDNAARPFVSPVGRWFGRGVSTEPLTTP